jgi:hypothetical protein
VKSPLSMNFGRISTSKCRGKLQKMGVLYAHSPKSPRLFPKLLKIHFLKIKKFQKNWDNQRGAGVDQWSPPAGRRPRAGWRPAVTRRPRVDAWTCRAIPIFLEFFLLPALHFLHKWSTLSHWLQHMLALPKLLLETSNIHNF